MTYTKDDIRKLIKAMGGRPISFNRAYAKIAGSIEAGLMLAQGVHWAGHADSDGWFFRTQADWEEDTTMSPDQQRTARRKLRPIKHGDQHLWQEKEQGLPKQLFFRVDMDVLAELLIETEPSSTIGRGSQSQGIPASSDRDSRGLFLGNPDSIKKEDEKSDEKKNEMSSFSSGDEEKAPTVDEMFETFWQAYPKPKPNRHSRKESLAKFKGALKKASFEEIMDGLEWFKVQEDWTKDNGKWIPGAQKWLNQEMWEAAKEPEQGRDISPSNQKQPEPATDVDWGPDPNLAWMLDPSLPKPWEKDNG